MEKIIQPYNGGIQFLENIIESNVTIFVIDDDDFYASMLKQQLEANPKHTVYTFHTGEASFPYLDLDPDLVIIDYHLDGIFKAAKKGDEIAENIRGKCPKTEIILISEDNKISLLKSIEETKIHYKHGSANNMIRNISKNLLLTKQNRKFVKIATVAALLMISLATLL